MNFWDTEEAGFFANAILASEDVFCKDILIDKAHKCFSLPTDKKFRSFQKTAKCSQQRHLYLEPKIPSLSQGEK